MKLLFLNWRDIINPKRGGAEIILYELSRRLIKRGHSVVWFCTSFPGASPKETVDAISILRAGNEFSVYWHAYQYYRSLAMKPDLVLDCVNTICWQTPLYVERRKRLLYANQSARNVFFYEYPFPLSLIGFLLEPLQYLTYKGTNAICYSLSIREDLIAFGIPQQKISTFPLGIDHKRYVPDKKASDPTFIFVARFAKNKRAALCIYAMEIVVRRFPNAKLYLVGYGQEEENLRALIGKLNLSQNVSIVNKNTVFLTTDERDMKVKLMQEAWALLLPSVKEGWGMVVTEAAACGTASIVSNVTGLKDSVVHQKTGIILSPDPTPQDLATSMLTIIKDKKTRESLSKGALQFAQTFSWEKSFEHFYEALIHR